MSFSGKNPVISAVALALLAGCGVASSKVELAPGAGAPPSKISQAAPRVVPGQGRDSSDEVQVKYAGREGAAAVPVGTVTLLDADSVPPPGSDAARAISKSASYGEPASRVSLAGAAAPAGKDSIPPALERSWLPDDPLVLRAGAVLGGPRFQSDRPVSVATTAACEMLREHVAKIARETTEQPKQGLALVVSGKVALACDWIGSVAEGRVSYATMAKVVERAAKYQPQAADYDVVIAAIALAVNNSAK